MAPRRSWRDDVCPFLIPVMADHLFVYPAGAYCRAPAQRLRLPAPTTIDRVCTRRAYRTCPGFRSAMEDASLDAC